MQRAAFLRSHTDKDIEAREIKGAHYNCGLIQDAKLIVSVKFPFDGEQPSQTDVNVAKDWHTKIRSLLAAVGIWPVSMKPDRYIRLRQTLVNWQKDSSWRYSNDRRWETDKPICNQIFDPTTNVITTDKGCVQLGDWCYAKVLSAKKIPEGMFFTEAIRYVGDLKGRTGIRNNYAVVVNIVFPEADTTKTKIETKRTMTVNQAYGPLVKFVPVLADKARSFNIISDSFQKGARPLRLSFSVLLFDKDRTGLESSAMQVQSYFKTLKFHLMEDRYVMLPMFFNCLPLGCDWRAVKELQRYKTMSSKEAPVFVPIFGEAKGTGTPHVMLISRNGQLMTMSLHDSGSNKNAVIAATSGSGKSFLLNEIIVSYMSEGAQVWVIDAGKSYKKLNETLKGDFLQFDEESTICLNPFELIKDWNEEEDGIVSLVSAMASPSGALTEYQVSGLKKVMKGLWEQKGITMTVDDISAACCENPDQRIKDVGEQLHAFTSRGAYGRFFTGSNNIRFNNNFTVLELDELQGRTHLRQVVLLQLILQIQHEMFLGDRNRKKILIVDEAWALLNEGEVSVFMQHAYRKFRKYNGSAIISTQSLNDLYEGSAGVAIAENSANMYLLGQKPATIADIKKKNLLVLSEGGFNLLDSVKSVAGVYSEICLITEQGVAVGRLIVSNFFKLLYSTAPEDLNAIARYTAQGLTTADAIRHVLADRGQRETD